MAWTGTALSMPFTLYLVVNFPYKKERKKWDLQITVQSAYAFPGMFLLLFS
jgi:hypothetical protein